MTWKLLVTVGAEADEEKLEFLLAELKGKDITEVIASGREKFAAVPSGGGAIAVGAPAAASGGGAAPAAESKKEEKVEEKEESDEVSIFPPCNGFSVTLVLRSISYSSWTYIIARIQHSTLFNCCCCK